MSRNTYIVLGSAVVALPLALVVAVELTTSRAESFHEWSAAYGWLMPLIQVSVFPALGVLLATLALAVRHVVRRKTGKYRIAQAPTCTARGLSNK